jgi:NAD(P)H-dependent flavin oxidoreductase YrpB (nitropropane dioxygenase family)
MATKVRGARQRIQGFVVELPTAGGHNAPPRKKGVLDQEGQPVYGLKDEVSWQKMQDLGIPFWIAGSYASPEKLAEAQSLGAVGIQAGSVFALSEDSGMDPVYRAEIRRLGYRGELKVRTDPDASPTGFPFKVPLLPGTISEESVYQARERNCSRKALQFPVMHNSRVVFRCPAEPIKEYLRKGGKVEDTVGAKCLCNGLFAAADIGNPGEEPIFTMGDEVNSFAARLMAHENDSYTATDAIDWLLSRQPADTTPQQSAV